MTPGVLMLTIAGLLIAAGGVGVVASLRGVAVFPQRQRMNSVMPRSWARPLHTVGLAAGVIVFVLTGWPVAGIATAAGVVFVPAVLGGGKLAKRLIARSDALADWTRRLADLIASGAAGSSRDALKRSVNAAPEAIAAPVRRLVSRVGLQGMESALRQFAREVDDPAADKIAGVLILRERNGGPGLADALTGLATDLEQRSRMLREVEAERAKPRSNMRTIVIVTAVLVVGMMLFTRPFLSPYSSALGQFLLLLVVVTFALALRWMKRLFTPPAMERVLVDPGSATPR